MKVKRMKYARQSICNGESVSDTCDALGLQSLQSFSIKVKQYFGVCPSDLRQKFKMSVFDKYMLLIFPYLVLDF
jgi:AraC-like DNA-binding protein